MSELAKALLAVQAEAPKIQKDGINPHFKSKYVRLDSIMDAILPILNRHGVVLVQTPTSFGPFPEVGVVSGLRTRLIHAESGDELVDTMPLVLQQDTPQGQGSALTYARRYAVMAALGLVGDEDDDGAAAAKPARQRAKPASDKDAKPGTLKLLAEHVASLQKGFPSPDPTHRYSNDVKADIKALGKKESGELTEAEAQDLVRKYEQRLIDAQAADKVVF